MSNSKRETTYVLAVRFAGTTTMVEKCDGLGIVVIDMQRVAYKEYLSNAPKQYFERALSLDGDADIVVCEYSDVLAHLFLASKKKFILVSFSVSNDMVAQIDKRIIASGGITSQARLALLNENTVLLGIKHIMEFNRVTHYLLIDSAPFIMDALSYLIYQLANGAQALAARKRFVENTVDYKQRFNDEPRFKFLDINSKDSVGSDNSTSKKEPFVYKPCTLDLTKLQEMCQSIADATGTDPKLMITNTIEQILSNVVYRWGEEILEIKEVYTSMSNFHQSETERKYKREYNHISQEMVQTIEATVKKNEELKIALVAHCNDRILPGFRKDLEPWIEYLPLYPKLNERVKFLGGIFNSVTGTIKSQQK